MNSLFNRLPNWILKYLEPNGTSLKIMKALKLTKSTEVASDELEQGLIEFNGERLTFTPLDERRAIDMTSAVTTESYSVSDTTDETDIYNASIKADELYEALVIETYVSGYYSVANDACTFRCKLGGQTIDTLTTPSGNVTDVPWTIKFSATIRSTGTSGQMQCFAHGNFNETTRTGAHTSPITVDTTAVNGKSLTAQFETADPGNSVTMTQGYTQFRN